MSLGHNFAILTAVETSSNSLYIKGHEFFYNYFHNLLDSH